MAVSPRLAENVYSALNYETVAASQTDQVMGGAGGKSDVVNHILAIPASTSPGAITLTDGDTAITVFAGGASSVTSLIPFSIPLFLRSATGPWKITTGADISCVVVGDFTS